MVEVEAAIVVVEAATQSHLVDTQNLTVGTSHPVVVTHHPTVGTRHLPRDLQKQHITQKLTLRIRIQLLIPTPITTQRQLKLMHLFILTISQQTTTTLEVTTRPRS